MTIYRLAVPYPIVAAPNSCALCGWDERGHAQWYFGPHLDPDQPKTYVQPDDRLRLTRMKLRRSEREDAAWRARPSTCRACPDGCNSCTRDESDCECYEHQGDHPDNQQPEMFIPHDDCVDEIDGEANRSGCAITPTCTLRCELRHDAGETQLNDALVDNGSNPSSTAEEAK